MNDRLKAAGLDPLELTCTTTACESGMHCFKPLKSGEHDDGECRECGEDPVDWSLMRARDPERLSEVIEQLQHETIRYYYWTAPLSDKATKYAYRKGADGLAARVPRQLETRLRRPRSENSFDGRQTPGHKKPDRANAVDFAQHATATCCRVCLSYWHDIDEERLLVRSDYDYLSALVMRFLEVKLPELFPQHPEADGSLSIERSR